MIYRALQTCVFLLYIDNFLFLKTCYLIVPKGASKFDNNLKLTFVTFQKLHIYYLIYILNSLVFIYSHIYNVTMFAKWWLFTAEKTWRRISLYLALYLLLTFFLSLQILYINYSYLIFILIFLIVFHIYTTSIPGLPSGGCTRRKRHGGTNPGRGRVQV